jgi:hypothetical protein
MKSGPDRRYTPEFRDAAVKQVIEAGRSVPHQSQLRCYIPVIFKIRSSLKRTSRCNRRLGRYRERQHQGLRCRSQYTNE